MATDIFKMKEEITEKMKPEVARHLKKIILYLFGCESSPISRNVRALVS